MKKTNYGTQHIRAAVVIQRAMRKWVNKNRRHTSKQMELLNATISDESERLRNYKLQQQQIEFENLQAIREEEINLDTVTGFEANLNHVLPISLPSLSEFKQTLAKNSFQSIGNNNFIITITDKGNEIFERVTEQFRKDNPVSPGKVVNIHKIQIVWNHQHQNRFLRLEKYYRDCNESQSKKQNETFTSLQEFYLQRLKQLIECDSPSRNIITSWFSVEDERILEQIAKNGVTLGSGGELFDSLTQLPKLFGQGLYFPLPRLDFDDLYKLMKKDRERKDHLSFANGNGFMTPIKKLATMRDDLSSGLNTPRTPRTPRGIQAPITLVGCYLLPGQSFPSTFVRLGGTRMETGYDSIFSIVKNKIPEASICSSYSDFTVLKDIGTQPFPIESESEVPDCDEIILFDERAILPLFFVTATIDKEVRKNIETTKPKTQKRLKQVLLSKDTSIKELDDIQVESFEDISTALDRGEKIIVLPGVYETDEFMISKTQIIKGSKKEHCIFSVKGHIIICNSISNVTIKCHDPSLNGSVNIYLIGENAILKNCIVDGLNIVVNSGEHEQIISSCIIQGEASVEVSSKSSLTIQKSRISSFPGIIVKDEASCHLVGVGIEKSSVSVQGNAKLICNQNTIFKKSDCAIVANDSTDISLDKVNFHDIQSFAVCCLGECEVNITDTSFVNCNGTCLLIKDMTLAKISTCTFRQCQTAVECYTKEQVEIEGDGAISIKDNIFLSTSTGIRIRSGKPTIETNKFVKCVRSVTCGGKSSCYFRDNILHNSPFEATAKSLPQIKDNQFTSDLQGISILICSSLSTPKIKRNTFGAPKGNCIFVRQSSSPIIQSNNFLNSSTGIQLLLNNQSRQSTINRNTFRICKIGVKAENDENSDVQKIKVTTSDDRLLHITLEGNHFVESDCALFVGGKLRVKTRQNSFLHCISCVSVEDSSFITIKDSTFTEVKENAIITFKKSTAILQGNEFSESKCRSYCVRSRGESHMELIQNEFYSVNGVHAKENSNIVLTENTFYVNEHAFTAGNNATATLKKNTFKPYIQKTERTTTSKNETAESYSDEYSIRSDEDMETITEMSTNETPWESKKEMPFVKPLNINGIDVGISNEYVDALCIEAVDNANLIIEDNEFKGESIIPRALIITGEARVELKRNQFSSFSTWVVDSAGRSDAYIFENTFNSKHSILVHDSNASLKIFQNMFKNGNTTIWMQYSGEMCEVGSNEFLNCELPIKCSGSGQIVKNSFLIYTKFGIQFNKKSSATCKGNLLISENGNGILVEEYAMPHISENIFKDQKISIEMSGESDTVFHENELSKGSGLRLSQNAKCSLLNNSFTSQECSIEVLDLSIVKVTSNSFTDCIRSIVIKSNWPINDESKYSQTSISSNKFVSCISAIECNLQSCILINGNTFTKTIENRPSTMISFRDNSRGKIVENKFFECDSAIIVQDQSFTEILWNSMENLRGVGCIFSLEKPICNIVSQNKIINCNIGLSILDSSCINSKDNFISNARIAGIVCRGATQTMIDDSQIFNSAIGILNLAAALVNISHTKIDSCKIGLRTSKISGLSIHDSIISNCEYGSISEHESQIIFYQVTLKEIGNVGIYLTDQSKSIIAGCSIPDNNNKGYAIYADKQATGRVIGDSIDPYTEIDSHLFSVPPIFTESNDLDFEDQVHMAEALIQRNWSLEKLDSIQEVKTTIEIKPESLDSTRNKFLIRNNLISTHLKSEFSGFNVCIVLSEKSRIELRTLNIERCNVGIFLSELSESLVTDCTISKCSCGITVTTSNPQTYIVSNRIRGNENGIMLDKVSQSTVDHNKIKKNKRGILAQGNSLISHNTITRNNKNIDLRKDPKSILKDNNTNALLGCFPWYFQYVPIPFILLTFIILLTLLPLLVCIGLLAMLIAKMDTRNESTVYWFSTIVGVSSALLSFVLLGSWNNFILIRKRTDFDLTLFILGILSFIINSTYASYLCVDAKYEFPEYIMWIVSSVQIIITFLLFVVVSSCIHIWCLKKCGFKPFWCLTRRVKGVHIGNEQSKPLIPSADQELETIDIVIENGDENNIQQNSIQKSNEEISNSQLQLQSQPHSSNHLDNDSKSESSSEDVLHNPFRDSRPSERISLLSNSSKKSLRSTEDDSEWPTSIEDQQSSLVDQLFGKSTEKDSKETQPTESIHAINTSNRKGASNSNNTEEISSINHPVTPQSARVQPSSSSITSSPLIQSSSNLSSPQSPQVNSIQNLSISRSRLSIQISNPPLTLGNVTHSSQTSQVSETHNTSIQSSKSLNTKEDRETSSEESSYTTNSDD